MAGDHAPLDDPKLTGISRYFNGTTLRGRANVAKVTYASIAVLVMYLTMKPKKK